MGKSYWMCYLRVDLTRPVPRIYVWVYTRSLMRNIISIITTVLLITGASQAYCAVKKSDISGLTAGTYLLDRAHASLIFKVNHLGLSNYTARFTNFDAAIEFDPNNPVDSTLVATVDPTSIETDYPNFFPDFNAQLQNEQWLNTEAFPKITFHSTKIKRTGPKTADIIGTLNLHGVSRTITLNTTFNGGYEHSPYALSDESRIGFSARGKLNRSDFGLTEAIPTTGSTLGVGDLVEIIIEAEFTK